MSNPIALQAYPQEMFDVMALSESQLPVRFGVKDKATGQAWRLAYYGFRSAVEKELERSDWDTSSPLKKMWMNSAGFAVRVEEDPFGNMAYVVIDKRVDAGTTNALRAALKAAATAPSEASSVHQQPVDHEQTLKSLGFGGSVVAPQQSKPGSGEGENSA